MNSDQLKNTLEALYAARSQQHLQNDPLSFCHRFKEPCDQEISGLIASSFAYGNVKIILRNLERIFNVIGPCPRQFVENFDPAEGLRLFKGFKHRFNDSRDLCALLLAIRTMLDETDSIEAFFLAGLDPASTDITQALNKFSASMLELDYSPVFGTASPPTDSYFRFLFPSPASGSACKRLCMFLRWMVRPSDGIDLGIWSGVSPAKLIIPVDAHIQRICRFLGFTSRKQADWKMAQEITASLRKLDCQDPVKYDFSICHLGISEGCDGNSPSKCLSCPISTICANRPGKD